MEYLPYCLLLDELKKDGEVAQGRCALEGVLYLTPKGEKTLSLLRDKLTHTDCRRIREAAPAYAAGLNERRQAAAGVPAGPKRGLCRAVGNGARGRCAGAGIGCADPAGGPCPRGGAWASVPARPGC